MSVALILLLLAIGAGGGFLSGLLGVGGGVIFVPALYFFLSSTGLDAAHIMHVSVATSMSLVLVTGASSSYWHHKRGSVDAGIVKSWAPFLVLGVAAGSVLAAYAPGVFLRQFFAVVTLLLAIYIALSPEPPENPAPHRVAKAVQRAVAGAIGTIAAMIGIGGAILGIPFMSYLGIPLRRCIGTGGALGSVVALPATIGYVISGLPHMAELPPGSFGYVNLVAAGIIVPASMALSPVGVHAAHKLPKHLLRRIFAVVLVFVSWRMF